MLRSVVSVSMYRRQGVHVNVCSAGHPLACVVEGVAGRLAREEHFSARARHLTNFPHKTKFQPSKLFFFCFPSIIKHAFLDNDGMCEKIVILMLHSFDQYINSASKLGILPM